MAQFEPLESELKALGASLVFIAAEKRHGFFHPEKYLAGHSTPYLFLLDEDRAVTREFGVYHLIGRDAYNIAHPATFVVDRNGVAQFVYVGISQTDRVPVQAVLEVLRKMGKSGT